MDNLTERNYFRQAPHIVNGRYSLKKSESDLVYMGCESIKGAKAK